MILTFHSLEPFHPDLPAVIAASIGEVNPQKIEKVLGKYLAADHYLGGCFLEKELLGVIGVHLKGSQALIKHLSVLKNYRNKNIGKRLIQFILHHFSLTCLMAETDDEAVGFYKALGFICSSFEG